MRHFDIEIHLRVRFWNVDSGMWNLFPQENHPTVRQYDLYKDACTLLTFRLTVDHVEHWPVEHSDQSIEYLAVPL